MIILDFLFKICFAPFASYEEKGKLAGALVLTQPLAFLLISIFNVITFWMRPLFEFHLSAFAFGVFTCILCFGVFRLLDRIYVQKKRKLGVVYHAIVGLLIPVLIVGSLIIFVMSLKYS